MLHTETTATPGQGGWEISNILLFWQLTIAARPPGGNRYHIVLVGPGSCARLHPMDGQQTGWLVAQTQTDTFYQSRTQPSRILYINRTYVLINYHVYLAPDVASVKQTFL